MIRVLHVVTYMGRGGLETMLMNYYRHIDRSKVQFDFLVHREFEADYDEEIKSLGGRIYHVSRLVPWSRRYKAELRRFFRTHPEYKIVHVHQDCLSSVALQCAKDCGVQVRIAHSHNSNQDKNIKYLFKRYYMRKIPETATELFACGKAAGDWMFGGKSYRLLPNAIAAEKGIKVQHGVYIGTQGPTFETPSEYKLFHILGADAVGMSTVPEVIVANHCGIKVFGISVITDLGVEGKIVEVTHEEVQKAADAAQPKMTEIMRELINRA